MSRTQYDVSEKIQKLFNLKEKKRNEAKVYYRNRLENPHRPLNDVIFDEMLFRHNSMTLYQFEYYKATPKNVFLSFAMIAAPIGIVLFFLHRHNLEKERAIRSGEVAYSVRSLRIT